MAKVGKKWERDIKKALGEFAKQEGQKMAFTIIPVSCMNDMMKAANGGDEDARTAIYMFTNWCSMMDKGVASGVKPSCVSCLKELTSVAAGGDGIGGWAQIIPVNGDGMCMVIPICVECIKHGREELDRKIFDAMEEDVGVRPMTVQ